jgi:uncharacterized protein
MRYLLMALGLLSLGLGIVGVFLPLVPTTPFLLLAAYLFSRSSRRFQDWLLNHPRLGPPIREWRRSGAIPVRGKVLAVVSLVASGALVGTRESAPTWLKILAAVVLAGAGTFILTRPSSGRGTR